LHALPRPVRRAGPLRAAAQWAWLLLLVAALPTAARAAATAPRVAVLPFAVNSAKPIEELGPKLAQLVRDRLAAGGDVAVLTAEELEAGLPRPPAAAAGSADRREAVGKLGADYLVTGSVTELAGHYSLDVKLTPAAPGVREQSFVLTTDSEQDLLALASDVADGVVARASAVATARVIRVEISGAGESEAGLRERLRTRLGEPYEVAQMRDDVAMLREQPGIASASADTERGPDGVVVRFQLVRSDRVGAPQAQAGRDVVAEVQVRGNRRIDADAIRARIGTRAGDPYRGAQVAKDLREIQALGFFRDVRVLVDQTPKGRIVSFEVEENPVVRQISITGNESVESDKIKDILTLTTGSTLDLPLLFENRNRIEGLYRAQGFYLAEVGYEVEPLGEAAVSIVFVVEEGKKLKLREISFRGNHAFTEAELREAFKTKTWHWYSLATSWFDHSGTYSEPLFLQDLNGVQKKYGDAGYLQVQIGEPSVVPSPDGLDVSVQIDEGRLFRVGKLEVTGDETVDIEALQKLLKLSEGEILNRSYLTQDVRTLSDHYADRGYYFANVAPLTNVRANEDLVDVSFQIRKGPLYFIREVDISGNTLTVDPVVRREVQIAEGQLYSQRLINLSRARIEQLGFFEEVNVEMQPTEQAEQLDMHVSLVERPTGSFSFGAGYSSQDGFVGTGSLATTNLFGRGYAANASADVGSQTQRFVLSLSDPYFMGSNFEVGVTAFRTSVRFEDFNQVQTGGQLEVGHALTEDNRARALARYNFASRRVDESTSVNAAALILRELFAGSLTTSLVGVSFFSDTRDDRIAPLHGLVLNGSLDGAGLGGFSQFVRAEGRASWYLGAPRWLLDRSTFVVSTRAGYALPFNSIGDFGLPEPQPGLDGEQIPTNGSIAGLDQIDTDLKLPLSERYFLGGLGTYQLRGFKARSVGPRRSILYQDPVHKGFFLPVGTVPVPVDANGFPVDVDSPEFVDLTAECPPNQKCNKITDKNVKDFANLDQTDVIGGNKFVSSSIEYRFPISETLGLQGLIFFDTGNAFAEGDNLFDVTEWRYGTGMGVQWFSPFGPLGVVLGFPLDALSVEDSPVFEFSVGGRDF